MSNTTTPPSEFAISVDASLAVVPPLDEKHITAVTNLANGFTLLSVVKDKKQDVRLVDVGGGKTDLQIVSEVTATIQVVQSTWYDGYGQIEAELNTIAQALPAGHVVEGSLILTNHDDTDDYYRVRVHNGKAVCEQGALVIRWPDNVVSDKP